jgi:prepilin-type N-terminal cleavage/methylation domain-containing protein/prepilin-type processing-associated H-X9-DG protein
MRSEGTFMRRGFTLIELLVVIAIIAILAAILFPVFAKAREKARQSSCLSNVKQETLGILQYAQDFDEGLPARSFYDGTNYNPWYTVIQPYVKSTQVISCPSANLPRGVCCYGYNESYMNWVPLANVLVPAEALLICDNGPCFSTPPSFYYGDAEVDAPSKIRGGAVPQPPADEVNGLPVTGDTAYYARPRALHNGGCNIGFADGHAKWLTTTQFYYGQSPADKWFDLN